MKKNYDEENIMLFEVESSSLDPTSDYSLTNPLILENYSMNTCFKSIAGKLNEYWTAKLIPREYYTYEWIVTNIQIVLEDENPFIGE